jgi:hypothetical protein
VWLNPKISVSPSVYIAFESILARDVCGTVGTTFGRITLPFDAGDVSSNVIPLSGTMTAGLFGIYDAQWTPVNFEDLNRQVETSLIPAVASTNIGSIRECISSFCTPQISIPSQVSLLDPTSAWATCRENYAGFYDPPVALRPVAGLTVPKVPESKVTKPAKAPDAPSASPKAPVSAQQPSPTPPPPNPSYSQGSRGKDPPPARPNDSPARPNDSPASPSPPGPPAANPSPGSHPSSPAPYGEPSRNGHQSDPSPQQDPAPNPSPAPYGDPSRNGQQSHPSPQQGPAPNPSRTPLPPPITLADQTVTPDASGAYSINGQTLAPGGPAIDISGTPVSLAPSGTAVVIGGSSYSASIPHAYPSQAGNSGSVTTGGLGSIIMSAFGGSIGPMTTPTSAGTGNGTATATGLGSQPTLPVFQGAAMRIEGGRGPRCWWRLLLGQTILIRVLVIGL